MVHKYSLKLHNSKYLIDSHNNYYKKINNYKLKKISCTEFYKKSKYNPLTINKLLHSLYEHQINDYILLRIPQWFKKYYNIPTINYIPADYQLANLIKFLFKKRIITIQWNQPKNNFSNFGTISVKSKTLNNKNVIDILLNLFGEKNIIIHNRKYFTIKDKDPSKIYFQQVDSDYINIFFTENKLKWMYKKLGLKMNKKNGSSKGGIVLNDHEIESSTIIT
jgi:hypothetical protein